MQGGYAMRKVTRFGKTLLVAVFVLSSVVAGPALAQVKSSQKVYLDNDRVLVRELTLPPGFVGPTVTRPTRVIQVLKGGTTTFTYPDGKKEEMVWKTGDVLVRQPSALYSVANTGTSDIVFYEVITKEPKK